MKKLEFEEWHRGGHSGIKEHTFEAYCSFITHVETELGKVLDDYPINKEGQCLDQIFAGNNFSKISERDLSSYRAAVRKYWMFRIWKDKNPI